MSRNRIEPEFRYVYFIEAEGLDLVKIGLADDPRKRLAMLQVGSPVRLILRGVQCVDDAAGWEAEKHKRYRHLRTHGEWFSIDDELRREMEDLTFSQDDEVRFVTKPQPYQEPVFAVYKDPWESEVHFRRRWRREWKAFEARTAEA